MSNDEEKEEEEVREHTHLEEENASLFLSVWYFFMYSRVSMHPSRDSGLFWRARPSRTREAGVRRRAEFRAFSHFGVVFPVSDDANRDVF